MAWRGSISRSLMSTARASALRPSPPLFTPSRLRPSPISAARRQPRRLSFSNPRTLGELGCAQSLMPLAAGARLTSHLAVNVRAFCELSQGTLPPFLSGSLIVSLDEWKRWVISAALPNNERLPDTALYLNVFLDFAQKVLNESDLGQ